MIDNKLTLLHNASHNRNTVYSMSATTSVLTDTLSTISQINAHMSRENVYTSYAVCWPLYCLPLTAKALHDQIRSSYII